eukprot:211229-Rhodomonas_salina.2
MLPLQHFLFAPFPLVALCNTPHRAPLPSSARILSHARSDTSTPASARSYAPTLSDADAAAQFAPLRSPILVAASVCTTFDDE